MTGTEFWRQVASLDEVGVREAILTGYRQGKPFLPYVPTVDIGCPRRVLDFGCGLGRNVPFLATVSGEVVGFDLPEMIERARMQSWPANATFDSSWDALRSSRFDLVFASLVFQHIPPDELAAYLDDLIAMAPNVYVLSRGRHDFGGPTMQHVARRVPISDGVLVDHDPVTNTLVAISRISAEAITGLDDDRHIEVLLHTASNARRRA